MPDKHTGYARHIRRLLKIWAACLMLNAGVGQAVTRYVSTDSTPSSPYTQWTNAAATVKQAYDACAAGDVIIVSNGVHVVKNLQITAVKPVTIRSLNGPLQTSINADRVWALFLYTGAVVDGFTVSNGYNGGLSSIVLLDGAATVRNCIFTGNASGVGGRGGAVYILTGSGAVVSNCVFFDNATGGHGGAVYVRGGVDNVIADSIMYDNASTNNGGAIHVYGGGLECRNLLIYSNQASSGMGGGIYGNATTMLRNCTITHNQSSEHGGGVYSAVGAYNTIIQDNVALNSAYDNWSSSANFTNCCIGWQTSPAILGANNITNSPQFVAPLADDFRLLRGSPCINTGVNQAWMETARDLEGRPRLDRFDRLVDRGCYEYVSRGMMFMFQ